MSRHATPRRATPGSLSLIKLHVLWRITMTRNPPATFFALTAALALASASYAGSHLWAFNEVFSNPDGTVQFIELHVATNANQEIFLQGKKIKSAATGKQFTFPVNLQGQTGFKYLLLATPAFAALPGAPTPDFILPSNFFGTAGDTLTYHVYDTWVIGARQLPTDCVSSLNRNLSVTVNTPRNYPGVQGSVVACPPCAADVDGSGTVDASDIAVLLGAWGTADDSADVSGDGTVDASDLAIVLGGWGACS